MNLKKIIQEKLNEILKRYRKWLYGRPDGERADLRYMDLSGLNLRCEDLSDIYLTGSDFTDSNLINADFRGSNLTDVNFTGAEIWDTNFTNTRGKNIISIQLTTSVENRVINYIPDIDWVSAGCFHGTLEDLENAVKITHKDNEKIRKRYEKAIEFIKFLAKDYKND